MNKPRPKALTAVAEQGMVISETFKAGVASAGLAGFRAELMEPEASTGQGVRSLQHIRLVPVQGGLTITIGSVHVGNRRAEVRSYGYVVRAFQERFGRPPPFLPPVYENLVQQMERVLRTFMIDVVRSDPEMPAAHPGPATTHVPVPAEREKGGGMGLYLVIAIALVVLAGLGAVAWIVATK
ncbi:MAG: hypothetical protein U0174_22360 [Polyangiaceae bacterium]